MMDKVKNEPVLRFPDFTGDWEQKKMIELGAVTTGSKDTQNKVADGLYPFFVRSQTVERINSFSFDCEAILTSGDGVGVGKNFHYINGKFDCHQRVYCIHNFQSWVSGNFIYQYFSEKFNQRVMRMSAKNSVDSVRREMITDMPIMIPSLPEQQKIASFLTAVDDKIQLLNKKKALLEQYKKGVMQQLFSQKLRFKDDQGNEYPVWETRKLGDVCDCLDNQRRPLNESEREKIKGDIPYWGANAIMGFVNDYTFDETIVLLAEDGGNFNEYSTRPIANISYGKAWVNNHTHVIRGKSILSNEFLYYSVVHKNITAFVSGGTRSKLTKGEMLKIPLLIPILAEQQKIAKFLKAMDDKINSVNQQIEHNRQFKKGLLQQMFV